jgi:hypothetical protein
MSTSQPNLSISLAATIFPNPTAQWGNPATTVQVQNSSAFIISVVAGGETFTIQPFVAQTLPLGASSGSAITIEGLTSPSGLTTDSLTLVWLLAGEPAPMQDGPLTSAALIAATLPPGLIFGPEPVTPIGDDMQLNFTLPSSSRTIILVIKGTGPNPVENITNVIIAGTQTGQLYYDQPPYLFAPEGFSAQVICPVNGAADTAIGITVVASPPPLAPWTFSVYADTDQYEESIFYNGPVKVGNAFGAGATLVTGAARLINLTGLLLPGNMAANLTVSIEGEIYVALVCLANGAAEVFNVPFTPNLILPAGESVVVAMNTPGTGAFGNASLAYAYP